MSKPLVIDYYTDVLCVWAWIAQRRIDELNNTLKDKIDIQYHYIDILGDVDTKMNTQWQSKGGYEGFAEHVHHCAADFEDAPINSILWTQVRPTTSANAHLVLKAIELAYDKNKSIEFALAIREAFFVHAQDISDLTVLYQLAETKELDPVTISASINNGKAMAALMNDYKRSTQQAIKGSPSYVMDGGRQTLYGNVGYRVLLANIEELLKKPANEASWC